jgi:3-oxoacyl-[acyl-carrier-protein] synthase II
MVNNITDWAGRPLVAVTGRGVVTSLGHGRADNWHALTAGQSGIRHISRFPKEGLRTTIAGTIDLPEVSPYSAPAYTIALAQAAGVEAIAESGLSASSAFPGPLFLATPPAELEWPQRRALHQAGAQDGRTRGGGYACMLAAARSGGFEEDFELFQFASVANRLADFFGTQGLPVSVSTACASGGTAIQLGVEAIRRGDTEAALCIGTDATVQLEALIRFSLLSALSTQNDIPEKAMKPFSKGRDGFVMAEGAGALVLESYDAARQRGAHILGFIMGCGEKADDYHRTRSRPDGRAIIGAIANAIKDAGISPDAIDYVNAHGTSTPENDKMECLSLQAVLGERAGEIPISSNKSMIGHTLSAAGAVEAVFSLMTIETGVLPPTINYDVPDPDIPLDVVANRKRDQAVNIVLSNSFGFGGQNVCLVIGGEPV